MNKKLALSICLTVFLTATTFGYWQWKKSPTYSLKQLASAIKEHDRDGVEKFLDLESVASGVMDQIFSQIPQQTANNHWAAAGQMMAQGFLEMMKPNLSSMVKEKFLNYVETGNFQDMPANESGPVVNISNALKVASTTEFNGIISVKKEGKIALLKLSILNADKRELSPEIRMRDKGGYWQVVGIDNFFTMLHPETPKSPQPNDSATVSIPTLENWITSRKHENELRQVDFYKLYIKGKEQEYVTTTGKRWFEQCNNNSDYSCRIFSYLSDAEGYPKKATEALHRGCSSGKDLLACHGLIIGRKTPKKIKKEAEKLIKERCSIHDATACLYAGYEAEMSGKKETALELFEDSCRNDSFESCNQLGIMKNDLGKKEDAITLTAKACDNGHAQGCYSLGYILEDMKENEKSLAAYKKGCSAGDQSSCVSVGIFEAKSSRIAEAFKLWAHACNNLDGRGCWLIGVTLTESKGDKNQIKEMMVRACSLGVAEACENTGMRKPKWL